MTFKPVVLALFGLTLATGSAVAASGKYNQQISNLQSQVNQLQHRINGLSVGSVAKGGSLAGMVTTNQKLSSSLLSGANPIGHAALLLAARNNGSLSTGSVVVGGMFKGALGYEVASKDGSTSAYTHTVKFGGTTDVPQAVSGLWLDTANLDVVAAVSKEATAYVQLGQNSNYNNNGTAGFGVQQAYMLFDMSGVAPIYAFVGKKAIDFGAFTRLTPYTNPMTRVFGMTGNVLGFGFDQNNLTGTFTVFNGGSSDATSWITSSTSTDNKAYTDASHLNNFAANLGYALNAGGAKIHLGAGYMNGTRKGFAAAKDGNDSPNAAMDANFSASINNMTVAAEYVTTASETKATGAKVNAWNVSGRYNFNMMGKDSALSASYGLATTGTSSASVNTSQLVLGLQQNVYQNVTAGLEYRYTNNPVNGTLEGQKNSKDSAFLAVLTTSF